MEHVECMKGMRNSYTFCRRPKGKELPKKNLKNMGVNR
jgi:hypothetical protein